MTLTETLEAALESANLLDQDQAAAQLARIYATQIEKADKRSDAKTVGDIGAKLLNTLTALGMTAAGRAVKETIKGGGTHESDSAAFDELRASFNSR